MNFDGQQLQEEFNSAFNEGNPNISANGITIDSLSLKQLWFLVKFAKHVRMRCRNNAAFNNYMNRNFNAQFREVPKVSRSGKHYMGLSITVNGETLEEENGED